MKKPTKPKPKSSTVKTVVVGAAIGVGALVALSLGAVLTGKY
jgi:hypothetical protein